MTPAELDIWLEATANAPAFKAWLYQKSEELGSDGCTGVLDIFVDT